MKVISKMEKFFENIKIQFLILLKGRMLEYKKRG
jgi:hypothetical protein